MCCRSALYGILLCGTFIPHVTSWIMPTMIVASSHRQVPDCLALNQTEKLTMPFQRSVRDPVVYCESAGDTTAVRIRMCHW